MGDGGEQPELPQRGLALLFGGGPSVQQLESDLMVADLAIRGTVHGAETAGADVFGDHIALAHEATDLEPLLDA